MLRNVGEDGVACSGVVNVRDTCVASSGRRVVTPAGQQCGRRLNESCMSDYRTEKGVTDTNKPTHAILLTLLLPSDDTDES